MEIFLREMRNDFIELYVKKFLIYCIFRHIFEVLEKCLNLMLFNLFSRNDFMVSVRVSLVLLVSMLSLGSSKID